MEPIPFIQILKQQESHNCKNDAGVSVQEGKWMNFEADFL